MQGLKNLRKSLLYGTSIASAPYNMKTWTCNRTTYENYNKIAKNNQEILIESRSIEKDVAKLSQCPQVEQMEEDSKMV